MSTSPPRDAPTSGPYLLGFVLALALTALPFGLVGFAVLPPGPTLWLVAAAALVQILVHLRFFLHLGLKRTAQDTLLVLAFAAVLIVLMTGGSLWIMFDLHQRMAVG